MRVRKVNFDSLYFLLCVAGIVLLAWVLKNFIKAGDEVIAGISAALITLLGVKLTNNNSQIALDKQLRHQSDTFKAQMKDQSDGFIEQIKHQNEMLDRQMKHQAEENDKERKQKFKHDQYVRLIKNLGEIQSFFSSKMFYSGDSVELIERIGTLNENINITKTVANIEIYNSCNQLYEKYCDLAKLFSQECHILWKLRAEDQNFRDKILYLQEMNLKVSNLFFGQAQNDRVNEDIQIILSQKQEIEIQLERLNAKIINETQRLLSILKKDIENVKHDTQFIIMLINIELRYNTIEDFIE
ncbi:hypothetical protein F946_01362 [Acinetobacter johnsonii ANC 3681]|uniref:Uncharacterized protein n=1 Tax=Acinetobacter johnsonii ANC 3681 TaxID=1217662 RepID=N9BE51_ACIJO|nr:hypothetical protein [Acinetobacter johnsonii]ENV71907.1 hypothetical protein F946_01362 [Acinetobacter johnsonii ANC 3681]